MRSVKATKKITKAMELISASRIVKAQQRVAASTPYANELTRAVSAVASVSSTNHPLTTPSENPKRAAVLIISADRGMAGAYSNNAIKEGEQLAALLRERGLQTANFLVGRKAVNYYKFRNRDIAGSWTGFSDSNLQWQFSSCNKLLYFHMDGKRRTDELPKRKSYYGCS